jgi:glycosyltransferase involved in cell wall biosynthesis
LDRIDDLSDYADVLMAVRLPYDGRVDRLFRKFSNRGKKIYFDIDDLIIDGRYDTLVAANLGYRLEGEDLYWWSAFIANWRKALSLADEVITTNAHLAAAIAEISPHPVHVVPNTLNQHQLDVTISPKASVGAGLHIGYFSGSKSHDHDFEVARQALITHLEASPSSRLTVVGHLESLTGFDSVQSQVTRLPFMDFLDLQDALRSVDLNIVPLQNSAFTEAKSELKYFEAAVAGTPTLASSTAVFGSVITDGVNGFLARPSEWGAKLDMIAGMTTPHRAAVADAARSHALANYSPEALLQHLKRIFVTGA